MAIITVILSLLLRLLIVSSLSHATLDTQGKTEASRMAGLVAEFTANHNGQLPTTSEFDELLRQYPVIDPDTGRTYSADVYTRGKACDGTASARVFSIRVRLEDGTEYCIDS